MERNPDKIAGLALYESVVAHDKGEWDRGFRAVERALAAAPPTLPVLSTAACLCLETGDDLRLSPFLGSLAALLNGPQQPAGLGICADWLGRAAWKTGRQDIAELSTEAADLAREQDGTSHFLSDAWCGEVWVELAQDNTGWVSHASAELDAYVRGDNALTTDGSACDGLLLAALLDASAGSLDQAIQRLDSSLTILRYTKYMPRVAWTLTACCEMLLKRAHTGDTAKAAELQNEALTIARELGMKPLIERILRGRGSTRGVTQ